MSLSKVIAIDGPSGSGKSTIAKKLAESLNVLYIDTGAMFRALAYSCDQRNIPLRAGSEMDDFLSEINLEYGKSQDFLIGIDGENLTKKIREHNVSKLASIISQIPQVREFLLNYQRELASRVVCVMEGRDIGTVVFPNAFCKFFVTASVEVRSKRRLNQLNEAGDSDLSLEQIMMDVKKRDESDMNREVAPLKMAEDADLVDTSDMELLDVLNSLKSSVEDRAKGIGITL
ncbi:cytidylate kinase [Halobacteriovorax marinus SJ]|uniref:Cytidylate kinase n=1 Tax=Halobacteriovorax marinus (strain ATCC BAA-682 / DSM 15412 / SJ) TaxID=862908 RepID=E1X2F6_HALMS|nr:(d)CMP kinase [Halobacteriovorax marinus]CBW26723.1 cytidylate kinase [Halobacteriovorax marinus SJ]